MCHACSPTAPPALPRVRVQHPDGHLTLAGGRPVPNGTLGAIVRVDARATLQYRVRFSAGEEAVVDAAHCAVVA